MEVVKAEIDYGTIVYVHLGYATVKSGQVVGIGYKLFEGTQTQYTEYLVKWFGGKGERKEEQEWFEDRRVFTDACRAFS